MVTIKVLKEISLNPEQSDLEQRMLVLHYVYLKTGILVSEVTTAIINDRDLFNKNLEISKDYFKSLQIDEEQST